MSQITKKALAVSLKELLNRKSLSKITVRDVVESCGVNRQTFYYHFKDIYDLLEWTFTQDIDRAFHEQTDNLNWQEWCAILISYMKENKKLILNVCNSIERKRLEEHIKLWMAPAIEKLIESFSEGKDYKEENKAFVKNIYSIMLQGLLMQWIENDMADEKLKNLDKIFMLMDGSLNFMLEKLD